MSQWLWKKCVGQPIFPFLPPKLFTSKAAPRCVLVAPAGSMADSTGEPQAWAPNPDVDGDWLEAVVVSRGDDGNVVLKTVANGAEHTCPADKLNLMNVLPEQVSAWVSA